MREEDLDPGAGRTAMRNLSPFVPLQFESRDEQRNDFGVVVLRGTFDIRPGERLRLAADQEPLVFADEYVGDPGRSSLHLESSIAPYKPRTDVLVTADAHAPGGRSAARWNASVSFGDLRKEFSVTGPRQWVPKRRKYRLTDPRPVRQVPIRYELAFGGGGGGAEENAPAWEANPVGRGFVGPASTKPPRSAKPVPVPQILPVDLHDPVFGVPFRTVGLGPVAPGWSPRKDLAGTYDTVWEETRWPDLPADFSYRFFNTGSAGLTLPGFAVGDESVELRNLTEDGLLRFELPGYQLATLLRFKDGTLVPGPVFLDTVQIEVDERKAYLTWRAVYPTQVQLRVLEVRIKQRAADTAPAP